MNKGNWFANFFTGLWVEVQVRLWTFESSAEQVDFIERVLKLPAGAKILDIPCGTGRHSLELARRGYTVTAVDHSEQLMYFGKKIAKKENLKITWVKSDMRDIDFKDEFDAVICMWGSFGFFDDNDNLLFLKKASQALKKTGKFLMDTHTLETLYPRLRRRLWNKVDDIYVLQDIELNIETQRVETTWTLIRGEVQEERFSSIKIYSYAEILKMAKIAGFNEFEAYGSMELESFGLGSRRLFFVAKKG